MRRLGSALALAFLVALFTAAPQASAAFGLSSFDVTFTGPEGEAQAQAGSHPYALTTTLEVTTEETPQGPLPEELLKDLKLFQIPGFVGDQSAVPRCQILEFLAPTGDNSTGCADATAVGIAKVTVGQGGSIGSMTSPVHNLQPGPGYAAKLGFFVAEVPITVDVGLAQAPPYDIFASVPNASQVLEFINSEVTLWGVPADERHDKERGACYTGAASCPAGSSPRPFLTMPRACKGPLATIWEADSWLHPGLWVRGEALTHDEAEPPNPLGMSGCAKLGFNPQISAQPTTLAAESPTGLDFSIEVNDEGLKNAAEEATAAADIEKAIVTLPEGMTANPSSAEGLEVCTEARLAKESTSSTGCPDASKLGTIEVLSPIVEERIEGALYLAKPYENPFKSLLALYIVIKDEELGVLIKLPAKVEPDAQTGRLITTTEDLPQLPFSHFKLHFREGARSPLVSPPACGSYDVRAKLFPSTGAAPLMSTSGFQIVTGNNESPCPKGATPPFDPGFEAGALNNNAGSFSPFNMRLTRKDGDQDLTRFSAKLPPGMVAKLAGTTQCPDAAIAQARSRTGQHGGAEEKANPSCPASSQIGRVTAGAGVGSILTYVPGNLYLSGPYKGAPLSVVAIVPALAGPFDAGTVVTREALRINPLTAEVEADGSSSDPIPHILKGIPLKVRDVRVYVDKPNFTLNPTSCEPSEVGASIWGGGQNVFSSLDDSPLFLASRFQAADCASLGFKPKLSLKLKGGTKRGGHPALTGTYTPRAGDANLSGLVLRLPKSAFLDQAHIRTICTRVQFAAKACPAGAVYGQATAYTPLLDQPLSGPVYLRSSDHNLPDFVADLHGLIDVEAVARIDSKNGGIRATFSDVPDAPLTKVVVQMQGAKKGLIVNSTDLCVGKHRANARFSGQNGKRYKANPVMETSCGGTRKHKRHRG